MEPQESITTPCEEIEAVVAVFDSPEDASRVAASIRSPELQMQRVSRQDGLADDEMPNVIYENFDENDPDEISRGMVTGGAIGAGSGLLFLGIPILNVVAPVAGGIVGAWIGAVAGAADAHRADQLPDKERYQQMLKEGKSFVVISGNESERIEYEAKLRELGVTQTFQHPPIGQLFADKTSEAENC